MGIVAQLENQATELRRRAAACRIQRTFRKHCAKKAEKFANASAADACFPWRKKYAADNADKVTTNSPHCRAPCPPLSDSGRCSVTTDGPHCRAPCLPLSDGGRHKVIAV